jgi:hypothetical protein
VIVEFVEFFANVCQFDFLLRYRAFERLVFMPCSVCYSSVWKASI